MFGPANHHTKRRVIPHVASRYPTRGVANSHTWRGVILREGLVLSQQQREYSAPMSEGAEQDEDVPDGVVVRPFVVGKKVSSCGIGDALGQEKPEGDGRQELYHRFCNKDDAPAHDEIDGERESRPAVYREDFIECAGYHHEP